MPAGGSGGGSGGFVPGVGGGLGAIGDRLPLMVPAEECGLLTAKRSLHWKAECVPSGWYDHASQSFVSTQSEQQLLRLAIPE